MCFILTNKRPKIATKDIVCYKTGYGKKNFRSPYWKATYTKNVKKKRVDMFCRWNDTIEEGYHSYKKMATEYRADVRMFERRGAKFIIPKGTKYYENRTEYVSETIIFKGFIK